jgi:hypothetical protein
LIFMCTFVEIIAPMSDLSVNTRLADLLNLLSLSNTAFSAKLSVVPSVVANIIGGRQSKPSFELLEKIGNAFPEVSMEWLVRGKGDPFLKINTNSDCEEQLQQLTLKHKRTLDLLKGLQEDYDMAILSMERVRKLNTLMGLDPLSGQQH